MAGMPGMRGKRGQNRRSLTLLTQADERFGGQGKFVSGLLDDIVACDNAKDRAELKLKLMPFIYPKLASIEVSDAQDDQEESARVLALKAEIQETNQLDIEVEVARRLKEKSNEAQVQPVPNSPQYVPAEPSAQAREEGPGRILPEGPQGDQEAEVQVWSED